MAAETSTRKRLRGWDTYVEEAHRDALELPLPDGTFFTLQYPSKGAIDILNRGKPSDDDFVITLCGEADGCRLLELAAPAPTGTLQLMLADAMVEWGLWKINPFREEDNAEDADAKAAEETGNSPGSPTL